MTKRKKRNKTNRKTQWKEKNKNRCLIDKNIDDNIEINLNNTPTTARNTKESLINTTPINRRRSLIKKQQKQLNNSEQHASFNITNLNVLFDSNLIDVEHKSNLLLEKTSNEHMNNYNSPYLTPPTTNNKDRAIDGVEENEGIVETPKIKSKHYLNNDNCLLEQSFDCCKNEPTIPTKKLLPFTTDNAKEILYCYETNNINLNPYVRNQEIKLINNTNQPETSFEEKSFFTTTTTTTTPNLLNQKRIKSTSTPIDKLGQHTKQVVAYLKNSTFRESPKNLQDNHEISNKVEKVSSFIYTNNTPTSIKRNNSRLNLLPNSVPKFNNRLVRSVSLDKSCNNSNEQTRRSGAVVDCSTRSSQLSSRRSLSFGSIDRGIDRNRSRYTRILLRIQRFTRLSMQWTGRLLDFCFNVGVTVKKGLFGLYSSLITDNYYLLTSNQTAPTTTTTTTTNQKSIICCKCVDYESELNKLKTNICELTNELNSIKLKLNKSEDNQLKFERLFNEFQEIRNELEGFKQIKTDLELIKRNNNSLFCNLTNKGNQQGIVNDPPPPPPPPLPPPPPPNPFISTLVFPKKIKTNSLNNLPINENNNSNNNNNNSNKENTRPKISLDDILKVKLKKPAERPSPYNLVGNRKNDVLSQIKLKPTLLKQQLMNSNVKLSPSSSSTSSTPITSTSPCTTLTRVLSENNNVWKVKRLKRISGYSFDDLSRRNQLAKRERERIYNN